MDILLFMLEIWFVILLLIIGVMSISKILDTFDERQ